MSELALSPVALRPARKAPGRALITMAWRNLWRVPRRTWLTAGGVAFALLLVVLTRSMQVGAIDTMLEVGTGQLTGHAQVQHPDYLEDPRMRSTVEGLAALTETLAGHPDVRAVAPRGMGFGLVSEGSGERSFAGQIVGIAIMVVAVQVAAAIPARRIWRLNAVEALRAEE